MWKVQRTPEFQKRYERWPKKYYRERTAALFNVERLLEALKAGAKPDPALFGFLHDEKKGVMAVDQKGGGPSLKQTRLYVYPDEDNKVLYLITLGDKGTQRPDIKFAHEFVEAIHRISEQESTGGSEDG